MNTKRWEPALLPAKAFIVNNFLVLSFAVAITIALAYPLPGRYIVHITVLDGVHIIQEINIGIVFFISGFTLNTQDIKKANGHYLGIVYGLFAIGLLTPVAGFVLREIPLRPHAFSVGLTIYSIVPTTLGVGVALVRQCKGNEGIALLLTVASNMIGVGLIPPMLKFLFLDYDAGSVQLNIDLLDLFVDLVITILAPAVVGKALRELWKPAENFAKTYRTQLSMFNTFNLAFIIWQTLSGARDLLIQQDGSMIVLVILIAIGQHLFYLAMNYLIIWYIFRMPYPEAVATWIMASQKSAPVAVTVISYITSAPEQQGLLAVPCIVGQVSQIFIGAGITSYLGQRLNKQTQKVGESPAIESKQCSSPVMPVLQDSCAIQVGGVDDSGLELVTQQAGNVDVMHMPSEAKAEHDPQGINCMHSRSNHTHH